MVLFVHVSEGDVHCRADVLQWLKDHQPREDRPSRTPLEPGSPDVDHYSWGDNNASLAGSTSQPQQMHKQRLRLPKEIPDGARAAPWAQTYGLKKLPKAAELTLEKVYSEWTHPPNAIVDSLWDLHQIPRRRALDWFAKRRAAEAQNSL
ncbi:g10915 [Coccomyxa viridis]|uniref:G10915 protein n=1 Tax=Coccomyxa viridis TaxID=1274662 RepID=A0ABP1G955_9CHLO